MAFTLEDLTVPAPEPGPQDWNEDGFVIKKNLLPEDLMVNYETCWLENNAERRGGWPDCTPYRRHSEVMDILTYSGISDTLADLIGEPAAVHLNLTGWVSTTRNWHQDTYLNPPHVGDYYAAVWIALETIHPDSGPFQFVRGSHRWPVVTQEKIIAALTPEENNHRWPTHSERILTPLFTEEIEKRNAEVTTYLPERGDVLFWHGRLLHRGSIPNVPGMQRKSLIAHYSGINHRQDMPNAIKQGSGWYFPVEGGNV
jgi:ectoine hydroxylase-related dioxygenase (phytanoyl-CoA dioxygenase family)